MKKVPRTYSVEEWGDYVVSMIPVITRIAAKYTSDSFLRQDCVQFAALNLLKKRPEQCRYYEAYQRGEISEEEWSKALDSYMRQSAKKKIFTLLQSPTQGNWYTGRTVPKIDKATGRRIKVHEGPRYSSLEDLHENYGFDITEEGDITWPRVNHVKLIEDGGFND